MATLGSTQKWSWKSLRDILMAKNDGASTGRPWLEGHSVVRISTSRLKATVLWASAIVWGFGTFRIIWLELFGRETFLRSLKIFNLDQDLTIPSWYSSLILAFSGLLLFLVAMASKRQNPKTVLHWVFLGTIFIYLSADESAAIHEMSLPLAQKLGLSGAFTFVWIIVAIPFTLLVGLLYIPFLLVIPRETAIKMLIAGIIYVAGVIGMGMGSGALYDALDFQKNFLFSLLTAVEEGLEILGVTLFIFALLDHLAKNFAGMVFSFGQVEPAFPRSE
jgi:hypothetical protein